MGNILYETSDLAALACYTATSIDNRILEREVDYEPINRLISALDGRVEENFDSVSLFYKALQKYIGDVNVDEMLLRRNLFLRELRDVRNLSRCRLENLRDFCIELCEWALAEKFKIPVIYQDF